MQRVFFWELLFEKNRSCLISNLSPETYIFTPKSNNLREVHTAVPIFFLVVFAEHERYDFS